MLFQKVIYQLYFARPSFSSEIFGFLFNNQIKSIFQSIFCPSIKQLYYLSPFFYPPQLFDGSQEKHILILFPGSFLQVRVQITVPMLSALLGAAVYFVSYIVLEEQFL